MSLLTELAAALRGFQFLYTDESSIQEAVGTVLREFQPTREFVLSGADRIDYLVQKADSCIGIEIKVKGSTGDVLSQLLRYADHEKFNGLILVTLCARHRAIPKTLRGKPLEIVFIGGIV